MRRRMTIAGERSHSLNYLWRDNRLPWSLKLRFYAASVCSTLTHGMNVNAKSAGNAQWLQLPAATPHHREVISRGGHQTFVRPSDGCANTEASVAGLYPADACRPPSAPCGAGPTNWTALSTWQPLDGHAPLPNRSQYIKQSTVYYRQ